MTIWEYLDRQSRRKPRHSRMLANVIGATLVFGFVGAIIVLYMVPVPEANKDLLTYMLGQLSGFAGGIVAYHYTQRSIDRELDATRAENTGKMADAIRAAAESTPPEPQG